MYSNVYDLRRLKGVGKDVYIAGDVVIKRPYLVSVGNHVAIDEYFYITTSAEIGDYIHIAPFVSVIGGADGIFKVGDFCTIAAGTRIVVRGDAHMGEGLVSPVIPEKYRDKILGGMTVIEPFSSIGTNAVIFPGVKINQGAVIGAGAIVTKDCEAWTVYIGNPARPYKSRPREKMLEYAKELGYEF